MLVTYDYAKTSTRQHLDFVDLSWKLQFSLRLGVFIPIVAVMVPIASHFGLVLLA